jgi:hypothetical protein
VSITFKPLKVFEKKLGTSDHHSETMCIVQKMGCNLQGQGDIQRSSVKKSTLRDRFISFQPLINNSNDYHYDTMYKRNNWVATPKVKDTLKDQVFKGRST